MMRTILILAVGLAGASPLWSQPQIPFAGSEVFRFALHSKGLKPVTAFHLPFDSPQTSLIVLLGDTTEFDMGRPGANLRNYVNNGGAILICSSNPNSRVADGWGTTFGIQVSTGGEIRASLPITGYRGKTECPYISPLPDSFPDRLGPSPFHIVNTGPLKIASHRARGLAVRPNTPQNMTTVQLARYADETNQSTGFAIPKNENHFAVATEHANSKGRFLFFASSTVFANGMMGIVPDKNSETGFSFDNGNWECANRAIDWLNVTAAGEKRTDCLFVDNGRIIDKFAVDLPETPPPPIPEISPEMAGNFVIDAGNQILNEVQSKGEPNATLLRAFGRDVLLRWFVLMATVLFVFFVFRRFLAARRNDSLKPLPPAMHDAILPKGGPLRQRIATQIELGNLYDAASRRIRDRFDRLGGDPGPSAMMPPIMIADDCKDPNLIRSIVCWLWKVGYDERPVSVSPVEWDRINEWLERSMRLADRGDWSFGAPV